MKDYSKYLTYIKDQKNEDQKSAFNFLEIVSIVNIINIDYCNLLNKKMFKNKILLITVDTVETSKLIVNQINLFLSNAN